MRLNKYEIKSMVKDARAIYYIARHNGSVVNNLYDADKKNIEAYLDRLVSLGYCKK